MAWRRFFFARPCHNYWHFSRFLSIDFLLGVLALLFFLIWLATQCVDLDLRAFSPLVNSCSFGDSIRRYFLQFCKEINSRMYQLTEINQRLEKGQLICPIPHRMAMGSWAVRDVQLNHSYTTAGNEEEPSFEILGIFLSKGPCVDQTTVNNSVPYFYGSPPIRSDNALVHDAEFIRKGAPSSSPVNISQKTSCGAIYATKPSVRIEGFALKGQKPHCNLSALA